MAKFRHRKDEPSREEPISNFIYSISADDPLFSEEDDLDTTPEAESKETFFSGISDFSGVSDVTEPSGFSDFTGPTDKGDSSSDNDWLDEDDPDESNENEPRRPRPIVFTGTTIPGSETASGGKAAPASVKVPSLEDDPEPERSPAHRRGAFFARHTRLRGFLLTLVTIILVLLIASIIASGIYPDMDELKAPQSFVSRLITPIQSGFNTLIDMFGDFFRSEKLKANIEAEYNALVAENEQLVYKAMLADELQHTLSQYEDMADEINANINMLPIVCTVIGKSDSNYFSTFTINKGSNDGLEDYMAVTYSGALIGYTESVSPTSSTVRTIIDSNASIAALIQSSRDQGTVRGTLGVDGTAMCRMYYLPDDNLPRPGDMVVTSGVGMSFPKGIPIGTVRESTRGMESNKQYIVVEPVADFHHIEYVIVLRYKPVAEAIQGRENGRTDVQFVPLEPAFPSPIVPEIASSLFDSQSTPDPNVTPAPTPEPSPTPEPTPVVTATPSPTPEVEVFEYQPLNRSDEPTPSPTPTLVPTPTPYYTPDPAGMTYEED